MGDPDLFSVSDVLFLQGAGIDGVGTPERDRAARSGRAPHRVLQAAADGALSVYGLDGDPTELSTAVRIYVDARPASLDECEAVTDLLCGDHVVFVGTRIALTAAGRATLARWSSYRDLPSDGGERG